MNGIFYYVSDEHDFRWKHWKVLGGAGTNDAIRAAKGKRLTHLPHYSLVNRTLTQ